MQVLTTSVLVFNMVRNYPLRLVELRQENNDVYRVMVEPSRTKQVTSRKLSKL